MSETYTLRVTKNQLQAISNACETCSRAAIGQFDKILDYCKDSNGKHINSYELTRSIESLIKPLMGLHMNASYGVGKFEEADVLFDMYQTIRHRLAWDDAYATGILNPGEQRKYVEMMTVNYDPPMQFSKEPLPIINETKPPVNELL